MNPKLSGPFNGLFDGTYEKRIPVACTFELNKNCNLDCVHCYIDEKSRASRPLQTPEIKNILKQLAKAGTLYLVFTGGEIFLRKDILELCAYARRLKFDLRLFTNATLITPGISKKLAAAGVSAVEISLYGKRETHEKITRVQGSFDRTIAAIKALVKDKVKVVIKCALIKQNIQDYPWLKSTAKKLKVKLQVDPTITSKTNGNKSALKYRLAPDSLRSIYASDQAVQPSKLNGDKAANLLCSAGRNLAAIDSNGKLYPCLQLQLPLGNLKKDTFRSLWSSKNTVLSRLLRIEPKHINTCRNCDISAYCQRCPGLALLEDGNILGPSKIACKIAKLRKKIS